MERVFQCLCCKTLFFHLDNIIIIAQNFNIYVQRLREVLTSLLSARLKRKPKKRELIQHKVKYLVLEISVKGITMNFR